jgi:hypothetical protein
MDDSSLTAWLLDGDPAGRWKVTGDPCDRARIATEGWGARLLAEQDPQGTWPVVAPYPGKQWFVPEPRGPSRRNTARARAVLRWWDG